MNRRLAASTSIDVAGLREGRNELSRQVDPADLEIEWPGTELFEPFQLSLSVVRMADDLQIDGSFSGRVRVTCDRCLERFVRTIAGSFRLLGRRGDERTHELAGEDGVVFYDGRTVELAGEIRQAIVLEMPLRNLCSEACRGLCPQCGRDLNQGECGCERTPIDPRWRALAERRAAAPGEGEGERAARGADEGAEQGADERGGADERPEEPAADDDSQQ